MPSKVAKTKKKLALTRFQRQRMITEVATLILRNKPRDEIVEYIMKKYHYARQTTNDIIVEAQHEAAKTFTSQEIEIAKRQIKTMAEDIMFDPDEISLSRLRAGELLGKLMKAFQPEVAVQNNNLTLNLKDLTLNELKSLLNNNDENNGATARTD